MYAFDRDGCYIGNPHGSFADNHPNKILEPRHQEVYAPIANWIAAQDKPVVIISNQSGCMAGGYTTVAKCADQFRWLMEHDELIQVCLFCPNEGQDCVGIFPDGSFKLFNQMDYPSIGSFRKPSGGMIKLAQQMGFPITHYVGDLSGRPDYAEGKDSDRAAAIDAGVQFIDVRDL